MSAATPQRLRVAMATPLGRPQCDRLLQLEPRIDLLWDSSLMPAMPHANDVTAIEQVPRDSMMTQATNGDGFTPVGPWVQRGLDPRAVAIDVIVNGERRAAGSTADLDHDSRARRRCAHRGTRHDDAHLRRR